MTLAFVVHIILSVEEWKKLISSKSGKVEDYGTVQDTPLPSLMQKISADFSGEYKKGMDEELIGPCGMNCALCSAYLAYIHQIPRRKGHIYHCRGCLPRNKRCAYLRKHCSPLSSDSIRFCYECKSFPCTRLNHIDARYRKNYGISFIENLEMIRDNGLDRFLEYQRAKHRCPECGDWISVHNKKCFRCNTVESWKE